MKRKLIILLAILIFTTNKFVAQEVKFGKVTKKELEEEFYPLDSSANAVVLYKKHRTYFDYNDAQGWILKTEVHERIKLYNKDGFDQATKKVRLYKDNEDESCNVKAATYNLENGKITKTKMEKDGVFDEVLSKNWESRNFTLPNLKEGCVIEWKYTIQSPYIWHLEDVVCQYNIPIKQIDMKVQIPEFFKFKYLSSRYYPIKVKESRIEKKYTSTSKTRESNGGFDVVKSKIESNSTMVSETLYTASVKNIPALVEEPYVNNLDDYRAKVNFEITAYRPKYGTPKFYNTTWKDVTKTIYDNSNFGGQLDKKSHFRDDLNSIIGEISSQQEKLLVIFEFVKNKMKWNSTQSKYASSGGIKSAYNEGVGNVADINLTLVAMLREAGLKANPIILSTRNNGIPIFPTSEGFNYVIAGVQISGGILMLDATEKYSLPNILPLRVMNWNGRLIKEDGSSTEVNLYPNKYSLENVKLSVKIDTEGTISGTMSSTLKNLAALQFRNEYNTLSEDAIISKLESKNGDMEIDKIRINNKKNIDKPLVKLVKFNLENQADIIGDKMYIAPLLFLTVHENPFKLEERLYPIDYGSPWKNNVNVVLQIPEGYSVESQPGDISLALPENIGTYTMRIKVVGNRLQISSTTSINKPLIAALYYSSIKEFYKQAIDNQLEKIVLAQAEL